MYEWLDGENLLTALTRLGRRTDQGCLEWSRGRLRRGYGQCVHGSRHWQVHRLAWTLRNGPIPAETPFVLHRCDNPPCFEIDHLFLGTASDNMRDMVSKGRQTVAGACAGNAEMTHCAHGHAFTPANTYTRPSRPGTRECRICRRDVQRRLKSRRRAA